jgi:deoxyribodipyrimidine photo-lyase
VAFRPRQSFVPLIPLVRRGGAGDPLAMRITTSEAPENRRGEFVLYWAQTARRLSGNRALELAISEGNRRRLPVVVYESLRTDYRSANDRIHTFVLEGVARNIADAKARGLRYGFFLPHSVDEARGRLREIASRAAVVVTDEFPAFIAREQTERFIARCPVRVLLVDGNGIVPMRAFSKEQYSAKFFRDRAHRLFADFSSAVPEIDPLVSPFEGDLGFSGWDGSDPAEQVALCEIDHSVPTVRAGGGRHEALRLLERFVSERLDGYAAGAGREASRTSELSPYLHFGWISIEEVASRVLLSGAPAEDIDAFLEQAVIRRELSFNFCFYRRDHDSLSALPDWAMVSLDRHRRDRRHPSYSREELERGETGDEVWNLAQQGLLQLGTIHNYLRMLWGKKIIEWSATPEEAHALMVDLHDRYAIDGRDPNTHAGILWCFGKHDRPWAPERPVFGNIRYMSSEQTKKKVDLEGYRRVVLGQ